MDTKSCYESMRRSTGHGFKLRCWQKRLFNNIAVLKFVYAAVLGAAEVNRSLDLGLAHSQARGEVAEFRPFHLT